MANQHFSESCVPYLHFGLHFKWPSCHVTYTTAPQVVEWTGRAFDSQYSLAISVA